MALPPLVFAIVGGICHGTFPIFLKAQSAIAVKPHPLAWTCYKAFWLLLIGTALVLRRIAAGASPAFIFSWWGVSSALAWVPASLLMNAAVPRCGVAIAASAEPGVLSALSFVIGWVILGEKMRIITLLGHDVCLAPLYALALVAGIAIIAWIPHLGERSRKTGPLGELELPVVSFEDGDSHHSNHDQGSVLAFGGPAGTEPDVQAKVVGLAFALLCGVCASAQYATVNIGKQAEREREGCTSKRCSDELEEQFDHFGSWVLSFGIGGALVTFALWLALSYWERLCDRPVISLHVHALLLPGSAIGVLWCIGVLLINTAVSQGGSAVMTPAAKAVQLITAGAWGMLYYKEYTGWRVNVFWVAVVWIFMFMTLLSRQKVK